MTKVVLITGGSSGIGKATALFLAERGFTVYGTSRNPDKAAHTEAFHLIPLDVSDKTSVDNAVDTVLKKEGRIDVLVNNAGMGITGAVEETPQEEIHRVFDTNLYGPVHVMKAVLPHMRDQKAGLIINVTSIAGYMGLPYRGIYSATKAALETITEAMRMEVKDFGIQLTNVAPGEIATNIAAGRYHTPVYEDSPYKTTYDNVLNTINSGVDGGAPPEIVAKAIYRIIKKRRPKIHYKVGAFTERSSIFLKRTLPDKLFEKLLINHYKL